MRFSPCIDTEKTPRKLLRGGEGVEEEGGRGVGWGGGGGGILFIE